MLPTDPRSRVLSKTEEGSRANCSLETIDATRESLMRGHSHTDRGFGKMQLAPIQAYSRTVTFLVDKFSLPTNSTSRARCWEARSMDQTVSTSLRTEIPSKEPSSKMSLLKDSSKVGTECSTKANSSKVKSRTKAELPTRLNYFFSTRAASPTTSSTGWEPLKTYKRTLFTKDSSERARSTVEVFSEKQEELPMRVNSKTTSSMARALTLSTAKLTWESSSTTNSKDKALWPTAEAMCTSVSSGLAKRRDRDSTNWERSISRTKGRSRTTRSTGLERWYTITAMFTGATLSKTKRTVRAHTFTRIRSSK